MWDDGGTGSAHVVSGAGVVATSWQIAGTGDFDGNGREDILWQNDNGSVSIWDDGAIGKAHIISGPGAVPSSSHIVGTGDYDNNGKTDILWRNDDGSMSIWDNGQSSAAHMVASAGGNSPSSGAVAPSAAGVEITDLSSQSGIATIKGTADAGSVVKVYDGSTSLGSATAGADRSWTFASNSALSNTVHKITAQEVDGTGQVTATSSGAAILGSSGADTITGPNGDDVLVGNGGQDTFVFAANFGHDVIKDFVASTGTTHDVVQFSKTVFDSFASVLADASQVGADVVISAGSDTLTLKNTKLSALDTRDFQFV
jgi:Ca2+-binding RTX toxin-like protein